MDRESSEHRPRMFDRDFTVEDMIEQKSQQVMDEWRARQLARPQFEKDALGIYASLSQDKFWVDANGQRHFIERMDPVHRRNCIAFMHARAHSLEMYYSLGESISLWDNPFHQPSDNAAALLEQEEEREWEERAADPIAWLDSTPLMKALLLAQNKWECDGDFITI